MSDPVKRHVTIKDFFDGPIREYSISACIRGIPHVMDGLKVSQRKVIFGALNTSIPETGITVERLAASVGLLSAYHHGGGSLEGAIVGLAQDYPGTNNINYLDPDGQFGSRLAPDASASRYIHTRMMPAFRKLFKKDDDLILKHLVEDGLTIEPEFYMPILPNVLMNGADGMGTGFACRILAYNPDDLKTYLLAKLKGKKLPANFQLLPWYRGFKGKIERAADKQLTIRGKITKTSSTTLEVSELPIGVYLEGYKEFLISLLDQADPILKEYENDSSAKSFKFTLTVPRVIANLPEEELERRFGLIARTRENLNVWLVNGKLKKFATPEALCDYFLVERVKLFEARRLAKIAELAVKMELLAEKIAFIEYYIENSQAVSKLKKVELEAKLLEMGFKNIDKLLEIRIYNMTADQIADLQSDLVEVEGQHSYYSNTTPEALYIKDLEELDLSKELKA